jgi:hypothetical protein
VVTYGIEIAAIFGSRGMYDSAGITVSNFGEKAAWHAYFSCCNFKYLQGLQCRVFIKAW